MGFVNARESKERLREDRCAVHIHGRNARRNADCRRGPERDHKHLCQKHITDPVTGFQIPASWIKACPDPQALQKIQSGRWVLLSNGLLLKRGLTTGTTAAAACKGAVLSLNGPVDCLEVMTPAGIRVSLPVVGKEWLLHRRQRWRRPPVRCHSRPGDSGPGQTIRGDDTCGGIGNWQDHGQRPVR